DRLRQVLLLQGSVVVFAACSSSGASPGDAAAPLPTADAPLEAAPALDGTAGDAGVLDSGLPTSVSGAVQKGPFVRGSSVTVQELDPKLAPTGRSFQVTTSDDVGDFAIPINVSSRYVEIIATGYYFSELSDDLSTAPLTLRSLADL